MASLSKRIKLVPGSPLWELRDHFEKLNARQLEVILKEFLTDSNVKITRDNKSPTSTTDFRIGVVAGVFLAVSLRHNVEAALTSPERCINQLAKLLFAPTQDATNDPSSQRELIDAQSPSANQADAR